ncbi:hypothetical protein LMG28688_04534 [Paraburkholderia caffeinitolerans]|uniref:Isoprenylcysteine carboxyl methyltransferase n=1 Tax=Paraburkholderia caffeinitolerans TaxID=1723730 RepID=A0A6J5GGK4_9BURK|nr:isoprenylcysteine carboxylmethyltransferase family protein [Paraburkholderia caffeinitolerans]CAB3797481.1 hypothetical protein LMG28688_04534 [Paraburkholderia caffeinitolerans]
MDNALVKRLLVQTFIWLVFQGALLFVAAGTLAWGAAWLWLLEWGVLGSWIGLWLARTDPGLLAERLAPLTQREQAVWDRIFMMAVSVGWCAWLCLIGIDAMRFHWSHVPFWLGMCGAAGIFVSLYAMRAVFTANRYAAPVVKIQRDRGHTVTDSGPYAYVRHPMYAFAIPLLAGTPLMLGSWWGFACVPLMVAGIGWRAVREERVLAAELTGYREYLERVKYRFVPGVW